MKNEFTKIIEILETLTQAEMDKLSVDDFSIQAGSEIKEEA